MQSESSQTELDRLRQEQARTREDEVFGGLSGPERLAYEIKAERIRTLEQEIREIRAEAQSRNSIRAR
jgi:hypothetical protein